MEKKTINLLIDASNIKTGGGFTHLCEIINNNQSESKKYKIYIFGSTKTLSKISHKNINHINSYLLNYSVFFTIVWKLFFLRKIIRKHNIDLLFAPGGWFINNFKPVVILSQNFILFNDKIINKYKFSIRYFKFLILKNLHFYSINNADGVIYLNDYIASFVIKNRSIKSHNFTIIPHGINKIFNNKKVNFKNENLIKLIYVSSIDYYKNQMQIIEAIIELNKLGYKIQLQLIGSNYTPYFNQIYNKVKSIQYISIEKFKTHKELASLYRKVDIAIFASSCENLPITLLEYMHARLPILCNNIEPMKGILGDGAAYFNLNSQKSIINSLIKMIKNPLLREHLSNIAYKRSLEYSWEKASKNTFNFIGKVYESSLKKAKQSMNNESIQK